MAERKGVERGGGEGGREKERERGLAVLGVNGRSARLTNIKMCTGDAGWHASPVKQRVCQTGRLIWKLESMHTHTTLNALKSPQSPQQPCSVSLSPKPLALTPGNTGNGHRWRGFPVPCEADSGFYARSARCWCRIVTVTCWFVFAGLSPLKIGSK